MMQPVEAKFAIGAQPVECLVKGAERRVSSNGKVWLVLKVETSKSQWASDVDVNDSKLLYLEDMVGQRVTLLLSPKKLKGKSADDGKFWSYWWEVTGTPDGTSQTPHPPTRPAQAAQEVRARSPIDERQASIHRQVALKEARQAAVDVKGWDSREAFLDLVHWFYPRFLDILNETAASAQEEAAAVPAEPLFPEEPPLPVEQGQDIPCLIHPMAVWAAAAGYVHGAGSATCWAQQYVSRTVTDCCETLHWQAAEFHAWLKEQGITGDWKKLTTASQVKLAQALVERGKSHGQDTPPW